MADRPYPWIMQKPPGVEASPPLCRAGEKVCPACRYAWRGSRRKCPACYMRFDQLAETA